MSEYIEREAAIHAVVKRFWSKPYISDVELGNAIEELPAADVVERKRGEWIEYDCFKCNSDGEPVIKTGSVFVCSECGREERYREPFCHCGADMREVDHA